MRSFMPWALLPLALSLLACGRSGDAAFRSALARRDLRGALAAAGRRPARDARLRALAEIVLEAEAQSTPNSRREAAWREIQQAGRAAIPMLERLASKAKRPIDRLQALALLAQMGERRARRTLAAWSSSEENEVLAFSLRYAALPEAEARWIAALEHADGRVRAEALVALKPLQSQPSVQAALIEVLRRDPLPSLRASAAAALDPGQLSAREAWTEALGDRAPQVRNAALRALIRHDPERAAAERSPCREASVGAGSMELASLWLHGSAERDESAAKRCALDIVLRALRHPSREMRRSAAIQILSLPSSRRWRSVLQHAIAREKGAEIAFYLNGALEHHGAASKQTRARYRSWLGGAGLLALQAATELAAEQDAKALEKLRQERKSTKSAWRVLAIRALAYDARRPEEVRDALLDRDDEVRITSAGAILASFNAPRAR